MITNGFRFLVGVLLLLGLIWTSAAVGDGPLFPGGQYAAGDGPRSVAIGDLDGDQVPDLAVANVSSDNVSVLLGLGDGTFAAAVDYAVGDAQVGQPLAHVVGDSVVAQCGAYLDDVPPAGSGPPAAPVHPPRVAANAGIRAPRSVPGYHSGPLAYP